MSRFVRRLPVPIVVLLALAAAAIAQSPSPADIRRALFKEIGYERLQARLRDRTPNGAGVWVAQVEPNVGQAGKWTFGPM